MVDLLDGGGRCDVFCSVSSVVIVDSGVKVGFLWEFASSVVVTLVVELPEVRAI